MFGVDDAIIGSLVSGAISGGASLVGGSNSNAANAQQAMWNNIGNANLQQASMTFNNQQGQLGRTFADQQVTKQQGFNDAEMGKAMTFNDQELGKAQAFNSQEAQKQRDYETTMSNTGYQRAMTGMKEAGLNPILAYQNGPLPAPSGASASSPGASVSPASAGQGSSGLPSVGVGSAGATARMSDVISPAVSNALQAANVSLGLREKLANIANIDADTKNKDAGPSGWIPAARKAWDDMLPNGIPQSAKTAASEAASKLPGYSAGSPALPGVNWSDPFAGLPNYSDAKDVVKKSVDKLESWISPGTTSFSPGNPGTKSSNYSSHSLPYGPKSLNQTINSILPRNSNYKSELPLF